MLESGSPLFLNNTGPQKKIESGTSVGSANSESAQFSDYYQRASYDTRRDTGRPTNEKKSSDSESQVQASRKNFAKSAQSKNDTERAAERSASIKNETTVGEETSNKTNHVPYQEDSAETKSAHLQDVSSVEDTAEEDESEHENTVLFLPVIDQTVEQAATLIESENAAMEDSVAALVAKAQKNEELLRETQIKLSQASTADNSEQTIIDESLSDAMQSMVKILPEGQDTARKNLALEKTAAALQQDLRLQQSAEKLLLSSELEELASLDDDKLETFVASIFDRLNMRKSNIESLFADKVSGEKAMLSTALLNKELLGNELLEKISTKLTAEVADKSILPSSLSPNIGQRSPIINAPQQYTLGTPFNQPEWGDEFGKRIKFIMNNNIQAAELRLDPAELGKINIKINMSNEQANLTFTSANQHVRDAIETALPRLKEMLAESGLQLGNTDVASQFQQQTSQQENTSGEAGSVESTLTEQEEMMLAEEASRQKLQYAVDGMIDYFA